MNDGPNSPRNPVFELLVEALDCADRLNSACNVADRLHSAVNSRALVVDAINRMNKVIELPDWLPQFEILIAAMTGDGG